MADDGVDPCECIWGHEMAMRRLMSLLRNSQSYCTDTICYDEGPAPQSDNVWLMTILLCVSLLMVYFRPRNRELPDTVSKPKPSGGDSNGPPPNPPPATM